MSSSESDEKTITDAEYSTSDEDEPPMKRKTFSCAGCHMVSAEFQLFCPTCREVPEKPQQFRWRPRKAARDVREKRERLKKFQKLPMRMVPDSDEEMSEVTRDVFPPLQPKPRLENKRNCITCCNATADAIFVHGFISHQAMCYVCAKKHVKTKKPCPLCKMPIEKITKNIII